MADEHAAVARPRSGGVHETDDTADLERFGYRQELRRVLGLYSSFAVAFSYISPSLGIFTLYALGLAIAGPFFFWTWPLVALGQLLVALNFAEASSHFPIAGSVYQWTKYLSGHAYSWFTGWVYLFAGIITITAVDATVPIPLIPLLQNLGLHIANTPDTQRVVAILVLLSTLVLSIFGVRLVALINNTGVVFEILGMAVFALVLAIFFHHQSLSVLTDASSLGQGFGNQAGVFLSAMFMSLFVIYGFDTASTLAEETHNPRVKAPQAVLTALAGALVIGTIFLLCSLIAIPGDIHKYVAATAAAKAAPPVDIITGNMPAWAANVFLLVVAIAMYVCALAIMTSTTRLAFGMARDNQLPFGRYYNRVSHALHTPAGTITLVALLAAVPFLYYAGVATIAIAATGMIYLAYLLGNIGIFVARLRGWPRERAPFSLGGAAIPINALAILWGAAMLVNIMWPRLASNPPLSALPNVQISGALGNVPIFEATLAVVVIVGIVYYLIAQRGRGIAVQPREAAAVSAPTAEAPAVEGRRPLA